LTCLLDGSRLFMVYTVTMIVVLCIFSCCTSCGKSVTNRVLFINDSMPVCPEKGFVLRASRLESWSAACETNIFGLTIFSDSHRYGIAYIAAKGNYFFEFSGYVESAAAPGLRPD
jgi:hypothetical protein